MDRAQARFEVISRSVKNMPGNTEVYSLGLLHKPDASRPEAWWKYPAGLDYQVPAEFEAQPGDFVRVTIELA